MPQPVWAAPDTTSASCMVSIVCVCVCVCVRACSSNLLQWDQLIKYTLNSGHLSNEDSAYCPSYIEMCTKLPLK